MPTRPDSQQPSRSPRPVRTKRPAEQTAPVTPKRKRDTERGIHVKAKDVINNSAAVDDSAPKEKLMPVGKVQLLPASRRSQRAGQATGMLLKLG